MKFRSFKHHIDESASSVAFTFGRFNPPTIGHGKLMDKLAEVAGKGSYRVYLSQSQDPAKNPLHYMDKIKNVRKMFPKHARSIIADKKAKTAIEVLVSLFDAGYKNVTMVVGADRVTEFEIILNKYNGVKARHGFYNFETIKVVSAGERDPDAEGVEGVSASKQREFVKKNDFTSFSQGVPKTMATKDVKKLFNDIRIGMGLKEKYQFKRHIELEPLSETREKYIKGALFELGDKVKLKESGKEGVVSWLGSNYLIVELDEGKKCRVWLESAIRIDPTDAVEITKTEIRREKEADARKHASMIKRAMLRKALNRRRIRGY